MIGRFVQLSPNPEHIQTTQCVPVQVWLIGVNISINTGIDRPLEDFECGAESWWESVAEGVVKIISENEGGAGSRFLRNESEGDAVSVVGVWGLREIRGR